jgi:hypothetical protein
MLTRTLSPWSFVPRTRFGTASNVPCLVSRHVLVLHSGPPSTLARTGVRPNRSVTGGGELFRHMYEEPPPRTGVAPKLREEANRHGCRLISGHLASPVGDEAHSTDERFARRAGGRTLASEAKSAESPRGTGQRKRKKLFASAAREAMRPGRRDDVEGRDRHSFESRIAPSRAA